MGRVKTTVEIDDALLKAAKKAAIDEGVTLRQLIEEGLRERLVLIAARHRLASWGSPDNTSREDLYAGESSKVLDDIARAFAEARQRKSRT